MASLDQRPKHQKDDSENVAESAIYPLDNFLIIIQPIQRLFGFRYFDFRRVDQRFAFPKMRILKISMFLFLVDLIGYAIKIVLEIRAGRLSEAQQIGAVFSIEIFCFSRGVMFLLKHRDIARICNQIDGMYPRSHFLQRYMRLPALTQELGQRFRFYYRYTTVSFVIYIGLPIVNYVKDRDVSIPVADEYHMHASWLPFGVKQSHRAYPFIISYEAYLSVGAVSLFMTWDHIFTIVMSQLCLHYDLLCREVLRMNARDTLDPVKAKPFFERMRECLVYMQKINRLGADINGTFGFSILVSDRIAAMAVCFLIYLMSNTDEWFKLITYLMPCSILVWLTFEVSKQGTKLSTLTGNILNVLYGQNWYEGSLEYRRYIIMWMQHANEPFKLTAFKMFDVNMAHFQETMLLAYQMFTFLKSRK